MEQTQITLLICIVAEVILVWGSIGRYKNRNSNHIKFGIVDKLGIFLGIPFLIFTVIAFFLQIF